MNADLEQMEAIRSLLEDVSPVRAPDRLRVEIRDIARSSRQRPRWLALIKEPPMHRSSRLTVGSPTARIASTVALSVALVLALGAAVVTGASLMPSPAPRVPPPYGPAANGRLVFSSHGDIYTSDPDGTDVTAIVAGPDLDQAPWFSHDGRTIAFARGPQGETLMVARADGSDPVEVFSGTDWWAEFMPSDTELVISSTVGDHRGIYLARVDGSTPTEIRPDGVEPADWVSPRPPTGNELLFTGYPSGSSVLALYSIGVDGTGLRQVGAEAPMGAASGEQAFHQPQISSDGSTLHYWNWETSGDAESSFMHMRDLNTGEETRVRYGPGHFGVDVRLSPDGTMVLYEGYGGAQAGAGVEGSGNETQAYAQPVDGSRPATLVGPIYANGRIGFDFSPDGNQVILVANSGDGGAMETSITDMATETTTTILPGVEELPSWQRLAVPGQ